MAKYVAETRTIASIYPGQLVPIRRNYGTTPQGQGKGANRSTLFELPPCRDSRGEVSRRAKPVTLTVSDSFESVLDIMGTGQLAASGGGRNQKSYLPKPVPVEEIVEDLLREWTGRMFNVPSGAAPGVIAIANTTPSVAELNQMMGMQTAWFEFWFNQGEAIARGDQMTIQNYKYYTDEMRLAAEWLGEVRNWSDPALARNKEACPACGELIPGGVAKCAHCGTQIRALSPELQALNPQGPQPGA